MIVLFHLLPYLVETLVQGKAQHLCSKKSKQTAGHESVPWFPASVTPEDLAEILPAQDLDVLAGIVLAVVLTAQSVRKSRGMRSGETLKLYLFNLYNLCFNRVLMLGASGVGKSSLCSQFLSSENIKTKNTLGELFSQYFHQFNYQDIFSIETV